MKHSSLLKALTASAFVLLRAVAHAAGSLADAPEKATPLTVGNMAPTQIVTSADGPFDLGKAISRRATILVFYRGNWCSLGKDALAELQRETPFFGAVGFQVIAVSTDTPESLKPATDTNRLSFPILSDRALSLASAYGVAFQASKKTVDDYAAKGISLAPIPGGEGGFGLLVPSVFIIDNGGVIRWTYSNQRKNPTPSDLIAAMAKTHRYIVSQASAPAPAASQL
jgi:peroxiredoxin